MPLYRIAFLLLVPIVSLSQQPLATIKLDGQLDDLQGFAIADSLFVSYRIKSASSNRVYAYLISPNGTMSEVPFNYGEKSRLCAITRKNNEVLYHLLTATDQGIVLETQPGKFFPGSRYSIKGKLISFDQRENELRLVSYDKEANAITIAVVIMDRPVEEKTFFVQEKIEKFIDESGGIMSIDQPLTSIASGSKQLKVYFEGKDLVMTIDEYLIKKAGTRVFKFEWATGALKTHFTPGVNFRRFSSFYHADHLYRQTTHRDSAELSVTHWESEALLSRFNIRKSDSLNDKLTLVRNGKTHVVGYNTLYHYIRYGTELAFEPCLLAQRIPGSTNMRLIVGRYYNEKGTGSFAGFPNPFLILGTFIVTHAVKQLGDGPGLANYFTLTGSGESGFELEPFDVKQPKTVRQKIDVFEADRTDSNQSVDKRWELYLKQKQYVSMPYGAVGLYEEKVKRDRRLIILRYDEVQR